MNSLIDSGYIKEVACGSNFSYVLRDNNTFVSTEYKVLQSQVNGCFVKCMRMLYNGKIQLFYHTKALKSFSAMLSSMDADSFLTITTNLFSNIVEVKHNGFLSCQNIDISFDKIFVDPTNHKVCLVYIPTSRRIFHDDAEFENELRTSLIKLISDYSVISSRKTTQFSAELSNGTLTLEDIIARTKGGVSAKQKQAAADKRNGPSGNLRMIALNAPMRVEIEVTKDSFVLGKNASMVDGVISFNKMISRVHCRIDRRGEVYEITDLKSANGTYVNRIPVHPNQPHRIKSGDVVRLANSDFQVVID